MDYKRLIEDRQSVREYKKKSIPEDDLNEIRVFFRNASRLIDGIDTEIRIYTDPDMKNRLEGVVGYRGMAFGAPDYIVIFSEKKEHYLYNAGYLGEQLCLKMTDMEIEHCWLTVQDPAATKRALLTETDKEPVVILAAGYGKPVSMKPRLDIETPSILKFRQREAHIAPKISQDDLVYEQTWGTPADWDENAMDPLLDEAFYAASLAPSFLNRQPYRYILRDNNVILCVKQEEITSQTDTGLDVGATMFNFDIIYSQRNTQRGGWVLKTPEKAEMLRVPEDYSIIGYYPIL
ncbi:MAG: nitroreductase family protein [Bilifractor sp.]